MLKTFKIWEGAVAIGNVINYSPKFLPIPQNSACGGIQRRENFNTFLVSPFHDASESALKDIETHF